MTPPARCGIRVAHHDRDALLANRPGDGLLALSSLLTDVDCLVVVAGLDAALASVVSGLTEVPVVAVPTSAGQGASAFGGFSALLTMLNSAAPGVVVSNIDNGWSAGVFAARIARRTSRS